MGLTTTVVGCGAVAQKLYRKPLEKLQRQGILEVTALVDSCLPHAETMHAVFPRATVWQSIDKALKAKESDLTLVLSPAQCHADHSIVALQHRNHVLCEKPMATTEAQCAEMIELARAKNRVLAIGMIRRFIPAFAQLRELVIQQELGEIRSFCYREGKVFDWDVKSPVGFSRGIGSGLLFDIGPHVIDMLIWLFGVPKVASYADDALGGAEANILMDLETPVCSGSVQLSWDFPLKNEFRVVGTKGEAVLRVDQFDQLAIKRANEFQPSAVVYHYPADTVQPSRVKVSPQLYTQSIYCQLIQFVRAIRLGEAPAVSGEIGKECVRVMESARRLARPIDMPWLDAQQREVYQQLHWTSSAWDRSQLSEQAVSLAHA
jgi:predicted dehydrogenase